MLGSERKGNGKAGSEDVRPPQCGLTDGRLTRRESSEGYLLETKRLDLQILFTQKKQKRGRDAEVEKGPTVLALLLKMKPPAKRNMS